MNEATSRYHSALSRRAAEYLVARGIDQAVANTFRLGVVTDPAPGHERFEGMLSIPYMLHDGNTVQMRFRCMRDHDHGEHFHGKYNSVKGARPAIYNVGALDRLNGDELHIAEGEPDAWILEKCGYKTVAIPGAHLWRPHFRNVLEAAPRIWVWGDPDEAGRELVHTITSRLRQAVPVKLTVGDVGETYMQGGPPALHEALKEARQWLK